MSSGGLGWWPILASRSAMVKGKKKEKKPANPQADFSRGGMYSAGLSQGVPWLEKRLLVSRQFPLATCFSSGDLRVCDLSLWIRTSLATYKTGKRQRHIHLRYQVGEQIGTRSTHQRGTAHLNNSEMDMTSMCSKYFLPMQTDMLQVDREMKRMEKSK